MEVGRKCAICGMRAYAQTRGTVISSETAHPEQYEEERDTFDQSSVHDDLKANLL